MENVDGILGYHTLLRVGVLAGPKVARSWGRKQFWSALWDWDFTQTATGMPETGTQPSLDRNAAACELGGPCSGEKTLSLA